MRALHRSCPDDLAERVAIGTKRPLPGAARPSKGCGTMQEIGTIFHAQVYALTSVKAERRAKYVPKECNHVANKRFRLCATRRIYPQVPSPTREGIGGPSAAPMRGPHWECRDWGGTWSARFGAVEPSLRRARRLALWLAITPTVSGVGQGGRNPSARPYNGSRSNAEVGRHG